MPSAEEMTNATSASKIVIATSLANSPVTSDARAPARSAPAY